MRTDRFMTIIKRLALVGILCGLAALPLVLYSPGARTVLAQALSSDLAWSRTGKVALSGGTAPVIASAFGTSPSITVENGATTFVVNVGTGGAATNGVLTFPAATTGWTCAVNDITAAAAHVAYNTRQTASTTTSVTIENQTTSTGAAVAWAASDLIRVGPCAGY